jgi:hypothetical protein
MTVLELFWKAGHHPQQEHQSSPPEICVKKLQRDAQKGVLQQLYPEDFEICDMEGARYHLIICIFVVLVLGPKHNTVFLLTAA